MKSGRTDRSGIREQRQAMLERSHPEISIRGQCCLLGLARSGVYRLAPANDDADLALMRRIDALFMAWPFLGSRRMTAMLRADGLACAFIALKSTCLV